VVGDETSTQFPKALRAFRQRQGVGMKVNLLVNYGWEWDLAGLKNGGLRSDGVSRLVSDCTLGRSTPIEQFSPGAIGFCGLLCQG
jgi:undecaprenyl diphosphate synthase